MAIKDDVLDIILHLRWWILILDIVIESIQKTLSSKMDEEDLIESLKYDDQEFETMLEDLIFSNSKLEEAAMKDTINLLTKVVDY